MDNNTLIEVSIMCARMSCGRAICQVEGSTMYCVFFWFLGGQRTPYKWVTCLEDEIAMWGC